jgi:hypothetical protein
MGHTYGKSCKGKLRISPDQRRRFAAGSSAKRIVKRLAHRHKLILLNAVKVCQTLSILSNLSKYPTTAATISFQHNAFFQRAIAYIAFLYVYSIIMRMSLCLACGQVDGGPGGKRL